MVNDMNDFIKNYHNPHEAEDGAIERWVEQERYTSLEVALKSKYYSDEEREILLEALHQADADRLQNEAQYEPDLGGIEQQFIDTVNATDNQMKEWYNDYAWANLEPYDKKNNRYYDDLREGCEPGPANKKVKL